MLFLGCLPLHKWTWDKVLAKWIAIEDYSRSIEQVSCVLVTCELGLGS